MSLLDPLLCQLRLSYPNSFSDPRREELVGGKGPAWVVVVTFVEDKAGDAKNNPSNNEDPSYKKRDGRNQGKDKANEGDEESDKPNRMKKDLFF